MNDPSAENPAWTPQLGECLVNAAAVSRRVPSPDWPEDDDSSFEELASATPYVNRMRSLLGTLEATDVLSFRDALVCLRDGASTDHLRGAGDLAGFLGHMLLVAAHQRLVEIVEDAPVEGMIVAGPERDLAEVHPLAAWGEAVVPAVLGDCDAGVVNTAHRGGLAEAMRFVPAAAYQLLFTNGHIDLREVSNMLVAEARRVLDTSPSRHQMKTHLATVGALFLELGLARSEGRPDGGAGRLAVTSLGCFGYLFLDTELNGPTPALHKMLAEAGYLPCEGGYVHTRDLPMPISPN